MAERSNRELCNREVPGVGSRRLRSRGLNEQFRVLVNTPGPPLRKRLLELTARAREAWLASAFVNRDVLEEIVEAARKPGCRLRFLTGTFGKQTRRETFKRLLQLTRERVHTRIWDCGEHQDFHAKLYLWKLGGEGVGWIGSANLTGGLWRDGELMLEVRGDWGAGLLGDLRDAFEAEWKRARELDESFVRSYGEARRAYPEVRTGPAARRRASGGRRAKAAEQQVAGEGEKAFLFTWNPQGHPHIQDDYWRELGARGRKTLPWSCGVRRDKSKIPEGSVSFIMRLGRGVRGRGIVAFGRTSGTPYFDEDWRGSRGKVLYVQLKCEMTREPERPIVALEELKKRWPDVNWAPRASATAIPERVARAVWKLCEKRWREGFGGSG